MGFGRKRQFAGELEGTAQNNPRTYGDRRGMSADVGGWNGMIRTRVWHDETTGKDMFRVDIVPHWSADGERTLLAEGILDCTITDPFIVPAVFA